MYYDTLPQETIDFVRTYRDHISLAAGEGEPLATAIYTAHNDFILATVDVPCFQRDAARKALIAAVDAYRDATNAAPECDCGSEKAMPNYRVCFACRLGRLQFPDEFASDPPDALFEVVQP